MEKKSTWVFPSGEGVILRFMPKTAGSDFVGALLSARLKYDDER